jgi:hypothetical protein
MKKIIVFAVVIILILLALFQTNTIRYRYYISSQEVRSTVTALADSLDQQFIDSVKGKKLAAFLNSQLQRGEFNVGKPQVLADKINAILEKGSEDKHLHFSYNPNFARDLQQPGQARVTQHFLDEERQNNYFLFPVQVLAHRIGYLRMDQLVSPEHLGARLDSVLDSLKNYQAIILDLRNNGGGDPEMVRKLVAYFYTGDTTVHINDIYSRRLNKTISYWTVPHENGVYLPHMPLYLLTSSRTFSAAEELAYDLQNLHRAQVIGERTGGGAHPGDWVAIGNRYVLYLPHSSSINPYSHSNWETLGVRPDLEVAAEQALTKAMDLIYSSKRE